MRVFLVSSNLMIKTRGMKIACDDAELQIKQEQESDYNGDLRASSSSGFRPSRSRSQSPEINIEKEGVKQEAEEGKNELKDGVSNYSKVDIKRIYKNVDTGVQSQ